MFQTYPEDFFLLQKQIKARKVDEYLMQASIVANPHKSPDDAEDFINELMKQRRWFRGDPDDDAELDLAAFDNFRDLMQKQSKTIKAK